MTQLCYTLEEAAERLSLSETVLVRLSQYFKVPQSAYEESGYLSFKGDLTFSEPDIAFFRQVKECLLVGETLDDVKRRVNDKTLLPPKSQPQPGAPVGQPLPSPTGNMPAPAMPIREIADRAPYEKAAEQSFERYKSMHHRTGLGKVFENMIKEVGATASKKRNAPDLKPMRARMKAQSVAPDTQARKERVLPFNRKAVTDRGASARMSEKPAEARPSRYTAPQNERWIAPAHKPEAGWDAIIREAVSHPRVLNNQLKNAAALLRERALQQQNPSKQGKQPQ